MPRNSVLFEYHEGIVPHSKPTKIMGLHWTGAHAGDWNGLQWLASHWLSGFKAGSSCDKPLQLIWVFSDIVVASKMLGSKSASGTSARYLRQVQQKGAHTSDSGGVYADSRLLVTLVVLHTAHHVCPFLVRSCSLCSFLLGVLCLRALCWDESIAIAMLAWLLAFGSTVLLAIVKGDDDGGLWIDEEKMLNLRRSRFVTWREPLRDIEGAAS
ncbi:hypothetical protein C8F01DRAFT_1080542 [Mycena amicta]|nr:hypothetical protein C8F01DRAFT_1080542 [Mycena amicta]